MGCALIPPRRRIGKNYPNGFNPDQIMAAREVRGKSRRDIVRDVIDRAIGLSVETLAEIEAGRLAPTAEQVCAIAMITGLPLAFFRRPARETAEIGEAPMWICGRGGKIDVQGCHRCTYVADYLCDFPVGGGKTCDLPICEKHRIRQGGEMGDIDYCPQHALIALGMVNTQHPD